MGEKHCSCAQNLGVNDRWIIVDYGALVLITCVQGLVWNGPRECSLMHEVGTNLSATKVEPVRNLTKLATKSYI